MVHKQLQLKEYFGFLGENDANPTLDIYLPYDSMERKDRKRPCLLICPGGGYVFCTLRESEPVALEFLPEGFNVFILNYTCAPARFPTQIREVAAAMEVIYQNSEEWHCDTSKVSIIGFSAGGHLAAHYSTMFDCKEVREVFPESKAVNGSVLCYPVITALEGKCHSGSFESLLGHYPLTEEEMDYFSCDRCVNEKTPPAFIWHTFADNGVPVKSSLLYAEALEKYNIPFELQIYPQGGHGLSTCTYETHNELDESTVYNGKWISQVKGWFKLMKLS